MATFQSVVRPDQAFGLPGEIAFDSPLRAQPGVIAAAVAQGARIIGYFYTKSAVTGEYTPGGTLGGDVIFGGIAAMPKEFASGGTAAGGALAPTLALPINEKPTFVEMGMINVLATAPCKYGDGILYDIASGQIKGTLQDRTATPPVGQAFIPNASVYRSHATGSGQVTIVAKLTN